MTIERNFDVPFIAALALREKAIQQNYRPIIAVHKWFARRPGTLFRGLLLAEYADTPLPKAFFESHDLKGLRIADPFMGGGTPLIEANRLGCDVIGWDINPMAWWIVSQEIGHLDLDAYDAAAGLLVRDLEAEVGALYETQCLQCKRQVPVKYFLWVKIHPCCTCATEIDLFPGYLVAKDIRHPLNVLVCPGCGELNEIEDRNNPGTCKACRYALVLSGPAHRGTITCPRCETRNSFPRPQDGPPAHRMFAIEYHCPRCKRGHSGRFFKKPDEIDINKCHAAQHRWSNFVATHVPEDRIPPGDESTRLHRWGYDRYRELFNERQLLGLELSCRLVAAQEDASVRNALATNLSDLLRYNNMIVRYDTMALKALDIFSIHGFPVGLVRCESNLLGIRGARGQAIGSGGWINMIDKYRSAKQFCLHPFEVPAGEKHRVYIRGEWIGDRLDGAVLPTRSVDLRCGSSTSADLHEDRLDGVFTDPPYFDNVQYAELVDFCYVWLRRIASPDGTCFTEPSTRRADELTGNATAGRTLAHFTEGLSAVYRRMAKALRPGAPFVFTYHHNNLDAYYPIAVAILDSGLNCSAALPCPAEMGGSIHISGTRSSIVDTVFVCRANNEWLHAEPADDPKDIAQVVSLDLANLRASGLETTEGDERCLIYGHLTRFTIQRLRESWNSGLSIAHRLARVKSAMSKLASVNEVRKLVCHAEVPPASGAQSDLFQEHDAERETAPLRSLVRGGEG